MLVEIAGTDVYFDCLHGIDFHSSRVQQMQNFDQLENGVRSFLSSYHSYHSSRVHQMEMELQDLEELGNGSRSFSVPNVSLVSMNHSFTFEMFL